MAKEPRLGLVKIRLGKEVGVEKALAVYQDLLRQVLRKADETFWEAAVYATPTKTEIGKIIPTNFKLKLQQGRGFGIKIFNALKENFGTYQKIVIIGVDCPWLTKKIIREAFEELDRVPLVIGPAKDGGCYLIGQSRIFPDLFRGITWGSNNFMAQIRQKCRAKKIKPVFLPELPDIDSRADLLNWLGEKQ